MPKLPENLFPEQDSHLVEGETEKSLDAGQKYREIIKPDDKVVVIGISIGVFYDASLLCVSDILKESVSSELYVVDPISRKDGSMYSELREKVKGVVEGIGNVDSYFAELDLLKRRGMYLKEPKWLGVDSGAQNINLPDESMDVIVDHNTSVFLGGLPGLNKNRNEILYSIYQEYCRVLKRGGKVLLQTDKKRYALEGNSLTSILSNSGFEVDEVTVDDKLEIPVDRVTYNNWAVELKARVDKQDHDDLNSKLMFNRIEDRGGDKFLVFRSLDQPSRNLFIAIKK